MNFIRYGGIRTCMVCNRGAFWVSVIHKADAEYLCNECHAALREEDQ